MKRIDTDEDKRRSQEDRRRKAEGLSKGELFVRYDRAYQMLRSARLYWFRYAIRYRATAAVYARAFEDATGYPIDEWIGQCELDEQIEKQRRVERDQVLALHGSQDGPGRGVRPSEERFDALRIEKGCDDE